MDLKGNDIHMCYGRHTGYGGYGERARGGRQILLSQDQDEGQGQHGLEPGIRTWIRLEDGTVSGDVRLNGSYGHDHYGPIDPGLPSQGPSAVGVPECSVSIFVLVWVLFFALG